MLFDKAWSHLSQSSATGQTDMILVGVLYLGLGVGFCQGNSYTLFLAGNNVPSQDRVHQQYRDFSLLNIFFFSLPILFIPGMKFLLYVIWYS